MYSHPRYATLFNFCNQLSKAINNHYKNYFIKKPKGPILATLWTAKSVQ